MNPGTDSPVQLSEQQRRKYERDGYLYSIRVLDDRESAPGERARRMVSGILSGALSRCGAARSRPAVTCGSPWRPGDRRRV